MRETEKMQRMAQDKLSELVATGEATTPADGDFSDRSQEGYTWSLESGTSGIANLDTVALTVTNAATKRTARMDTVVYVPPVTTTAGATP